MQPLAQPLSVRLGPSLRIQLSSCLCLPQWACCHGLPLSPPETVLDTLPPFQENVQEQRQTSLSVCCESQPPTGIHPLQQDLVPAGPWSPAKAVDLSTSDSPRPCLPEYLPSGSLLLEHLCYAQCLLCSPRVHTCLFSLLFHFTLPRVCMTGPRAEDSGITP